MNQPRIGTPFGTGQSYGSEAYKFSGQGSGFERSTGNDQSYLKTAISLTGAETCRGRSLKGDFSGRRLLFGSQTIIRLMRTHY